MVTHRKPSEEKDTTKQPRAQLKFKLSFLSAKIELSLNAVSDRQLLLVFLFVIVVMLLTWLITRF